jgi:predicted flap endonuclease-1-like 5' DNA nuclease
MIYLITQLAGWLLLAAAFAAIAGWVYAAVRARPAENAQRREREKLVRDLGALAAGDAAPPADTSELDSLRSRVNVEAARAAAAERALEAARSRAEEATGQLAALQRAVDERDDAAEAAPQRALEVVATPVVEEAPALQSWRLRYFEQRVRYLESVEPAAAPEIPEAAQEASLEWRARVAEARAEHLEQELREAERAPQPLALAEPGPTPLQEVAAFASNADADALLRWRMLYLERRVAHLQAQGAEPAQPIAQAEGPDPELWKWRARYLEARLRHLETAAPAPVAPTPMAVADIAQAAAPSQPAAPAIATERPDTLAGARGGGPDDLTLIESVSLLQQTTFYSLGVFHFDQIAAWSPANVAWVDQYFRLRGRIVDEEWVEQAAELARDGVSAARRVLEDEDA